MVRGVFRLFRRFRPYWGSGLPWGGEEKSVDTRARNVKETKGEGADQEMLGCLPGSWAKDARPS